MNLGDAKRVARARRRGTSISDQDYFSFAGGLNLVDSALELRPGEVLASLNYEPGARGGYETFQGYARYDGRPGPYEAGQVAYIPIQFDAAAAAALDAIVPGDLMIGLDSGATARVLYTRRDSPGSFNWEPQGDSLLGVIAPGAFTGRRHPNMQYLGPLTWREGPLRYGRLHGFKERASSYPANVNLQRSTVGLGAGYDLAIGDQLLASAYVKLDPDTSKDGGFYLTTASRHNWTGLGSNWCGVILFRQGGVYSTYVYGEHLLGEADARVAAGGAELVDAANDVWRVWFLTPAVTSAFAIGDLMGGITDSLSIAGGGWTGGLLTDHVPEVSAPFDFTVYTSGWQREISPPDLTGPNGYSNNSPLDPTRTSSTGIVFDGVSGRAGLFHLFVYGITGTFQPGEQLWVNGGFMNGLDGSNIRSEGLQYGSVRPQLEYDEAFSTEQFAKPELYALVRAQITQPPGSGPVRGVHFGTFQASGQAVAYILAIRDNDDASAGRVWLAGDAFGGWTEKTFEPVLAFDAGSAELVAGETVTGGTSGATGQVQNVVVTSGTYGTADAAGTLVLEGVVGTFQDNEALTGSSGGAATVNGTLVTPTLAPGGRYEFRGHNFYGASDRVGVYFVGGVDQACELYFKPLTTLRKLPTGMPDDKPNHLAIHKESLFLSFPGGSIQFSAAGKPDIWNVILGAGELGLGADCTGMLEEIGASLFFQTTADTWVLTGTSVDDYDLDRYGPGVGARAYSMQRVGRGVFVTDEGLSSLAATDVFGQFEYKTFSRKITSLLQGIIPLITASATVRRKNRYRLFLSDGRFISVGFGTKNPEILICKPGFIAFCAGSGEDVAGRERSFVGGTDGWVYELDSGLDYDGKDRLCALRLPFHHSGRPERMKHYRRAVLDGVVSGPTTLEVEVSTTYGVGVPFKLDASAPAGGFFWDSDWHWDDGASWDAPVSALKPIKLDSDGLNVSLTLRHRAAGEQPHTFRGITFQTSVRKLRRRNDRV